MGSDSYLRIDFEMPKEPWKLDDTKVDSGLLRYRTQAAIDHHSRLKQQFCSVIKAPYPAFKPWNL
jgi:hypothetical protein